MSFSNILMNANDIVLNNKYPYLLDFDRILYFDQNIYYTFYLSDNTE